MYALKAIIGSDGSQVIGDLILRILYAKLGCKYEKNREKTFHEHVEEIKKRNFSAGGQRDL